MFGELDTMTAAAGIGGVVVGALLRHFLGPKGPSPSSLDFRRSDMKTWNINDEWHNILSRKKKEEFAQAELQRVKKFIQEKRAERVQLRKQQDAVLDQVKEVRDLVSAASSDYEQKAILARMGDISGEHSSIRRAFDKITNALVNSEQSKSFLELVIAGQSKDQIKKSMDNTNVRHAIENNEGLANEMFDAEMKAFGSARTFDEMKKALDIKS